MSISSVPYDAPHARRYGGRTTVERRAERRAALIEAAVGVYGRLGYRNASIKAVCEVAGLTERYFYESFESSAQLLAATYQTVTARLHADMRAAAEAAGGGSARRVRAALLTYYTRLREHPQAARVFLVEIGGVSPEVDAVVSQTLRASIDLIAPGHAGAKRTPSQRLLAAGVVGGVIQIALEWIASGYAAPIDDVVDAAIQISAVARASRPRSKSTKSRQA